jgi:lipoic acid synthetase
LRYAPLETFKMFEDAAKQMGFSHAACGPMVRSSYFADVQAQGAGVFESNL